MVERRSSLDADALERLRDASDGDNAFLTEIVEEFLADAPDQLDTIDRSVASGAINEVLRAAHTLKSTSATFGATTLEALAREMEGLAREERLNEVERLSRQARDELGRVAELLRALDLEGEQ